MAQEPAAIQSIQPPRVVQRRDASYPSGVDAVGQVAVSVVLSVSIDVAGQVVDVEVLHSGGASFDAAAVEAMRHWLFEPARRAGKAVRSRIEVPFDFAVPAPGASKSSTASASELSLAADASDATQAQSPSVAAQPPAQANVPGDMAEPIAEVTVLAEHRLASRGAGDYSLNVGKLAAVPHADAASLLRLAPGVMLINEGGLGHPYQIFLRGFDAREGQDIEFTVEGQPINEVGNPHGNGLADTHFIIPELVQSLRVVEGPFAPQQGNFAVAGSARYELGLPAPGLSLQAMAGSFATRRLLLTWRPDGSNDHTFAGAELFSTAGFGQNRAGQRGTAMAGYEARLGDSTSLRLLATSYAAHYGQAGLLRLDDVEAGRQSFYSTYDPSQGGDSERHSLGLTLAGTLADTEFSQAVFLVLRDFRMRENLTGFQEDPQQTWQTPHVQRGDLIDQQASEATLVASGSSRQRGTFLQQKQALELGYLARYDQVDAVQQRNRVGTNIPYRTDLALDSSIANVAVYADADLRPLAWITLRGGLRADLYAYRVTNRCALTTQNSFGGDPLDTECFESDRSGYRSPDQTASTSASLFQPRATLLVGPFAGFEFSASYGQGSRSLDPQYINQNLDTPFASIDAYEAGVSYQTASAAADVTLRTSVFETRVDKDLFFNQTEGRNTLAGGTTRAGWAGSARATGAFWDVAGNLTLVRSSFDDTHLAVPYAPGTVARADGVLFGSSPFSLAGAPLFGTLGTGISYIGPRPLPFGEQAIASFLIDAGASLRWRAASLGLTVTNLLDRKYRLGEYNYASDFRSRDYPTLVAARHFSAGEPRAAYLTLTVTLGTSESEP